jgi:soluble lytic murein transglycosylase-like protein
VEVLKAALAGIALVWAAPAAAQATDRWSDEIAEASARFAIPAAWIRDVMRVESGGRTMLNGAPIVSGAGAMGLMQLMPGTWREMRLALGLGLDPQQPRDNILAGAAYLRLLYDRFGYPGLFAAYNAGPARYAAVLSGRRGLPAETRAYLARISAPAGASPGRPPMALLFALEAGRASEIRPAVPVPSNRSGGLFVPLGSVAAP